MEHGAKAFAPWLLAGLVAVAAPAGAATILEKKVAIDIRPDGKVAERWHLAVRLDAERDQGTWSPYPIYLDQNRKLTSLAAAVRRPDGGLVKVGRRDLDTVEYAGDDVLHSSQRFRTVTFPAAPVGSVLALDYEVEEDPYFRSGLVELGAEDPIERLEVQVRGGGAGWRWRMDGALAGLAVQETGGGVSVVADHLPAISPPERAPDDAGSGAVLRFAWGEERDWQGIGRWYRGLLAQVPRGDEAVRRRARELVASVPGRRERLAALLDFVRRQVRYVAVEVGIGGYRPHAPAEVLGRAWGDCKDKAMLLVDLLREAGVEAYPALIRAGSGERLDRDFPSPDQFNHQIVAVPTAGLELAPDDPVAGGYLFLDATQTVGGLRWLSPWVQDQDALVVREDGGELVRTPIRQGLEVQLVEVEVAVGASGNAAGEARLVVSGSLGARLGELVAAGPPEPVEDIGRTLLGQLLPGVALRDLRWTRQPDDLPRFTFAAKVDMPGFIQGLADTAGAPAGTPLVLQLPAAPATPPPSLLEGRTLPVVVSPGVDRISWRMSLPPGWCPIAGQEQKVETPVGSFRHQVVGGAGKVTIERTTELTRRWIDPDAFTALKELALAEHRTSKRRVRLECGGKP